MKSDNYFEGTLQLRDVGKDVYAFVKEQMKKYDVGIAKTVSLKNGKDYWVSSNAFLLKMTKLLPQRFAGEVKTSKKLFSRDNQTGKEIYRITVLFKQHPFRVGDVLEHQGEQVKVIAISGSKVTVKEVKTGKKSFLK